MHQQVISIRPFIGAKDFQVSRNFYLLLGFEEVMISAGLSCFKNGVIAFYLQDAYVKDWIDNTMIFVEVADVTEYYRELVELALPAKFDTVRLVPIREYDWGSECFLHDPAGILWHFGTFTK